MSPELEQRLAAGAVPEQPCPPRIYEPLNPADRDALARLLDSSSDLCIHDTLDEQLRDLLASRAPQRPMDRAQLDELSRAHRAGAALSEYGCWVHFPWSRRLVHLLGAAEFRELRSDRNRYKITPAEQALLRHRRIGVVGLSVGQATAVTLALEGVGGHFRLADFDTLALSNLNRLRAGVHGLGVNKAILASREMYEINPYLEVELFTAGITDADLDPFLEGLDLLVEECDDLYVKVRIRERARELGIPVIMETSDRGMLDIERFDREPRRPLFHGLLGDTRAESLRQLPTPDKVPYVLRILGERAMSTAGLASLVEIRETISTWPQLASGVALGGALATDAARRVLLGELTVSGRYYVDLDEIIRDGSQRAVPDLGPLAVAAPPEALLPWRSPPRPTPTAGAPSSEELRWLVEHAVLAPSPANSQPWRFVAREGLLDCRVDESRLGACLDAEGRASRLAVGCAVENLVLAAGALGLACAVECAPDPADEWLAARIRFRRVAAFEDPLFPMIGPRATNRRVGARVPLSEPHREALIASLPAGARLDFVVDAEPLDHLGRLAGALDRIAALSEKMHRDWVSALRWSEAEVLERRDGIDLATLELSPFEIALMRVRADGAAMRSVRRFGGGAGLERAGRRGVAGSSAVALLSVSDAPALAWLRGGRALERAWLTATAHGLALQPIGNLALLFSAFSDEECALVPEDVRAIEGLRADFRSLFALPAGNTATIVFRLGQAAPPTARALRRRAEDVLALFD